MQARLFRCRLVRAGQRLAPVGRRAWRCRRRRAPPRWFPGWSVHPLTGPDHLAAMLAVGCWSALTARRIWLAPAGVRRDVAGRCADGSGGSGLPAVEPVIAASLLVLGLLVAARTQLPGLRPRRWWAFAVFHGVAHGAELAGDGKAWLPLAGMLLATVGLHLAGIGSATPCASATCGGRGWQGSIVTVLGAALLIRMV
jgi:urease accessory protein